MNIDTTISENAAIAIDVTNAGIGGDNAFHSFCGCRAGCGSAGHAGHRFSLSKINYRCEGTPDKGGECNFPLYAKTRTPSKWRQYFCEVGEWSDHMTFLAGGHDGQIPRAVLIRICCCNSALSGSVWNSSKFFLISGTPGPGQSVPNKVLCAISSRRGKYFSK